MKKPIILLISFLMIGIFSVSAQDTYHISGYVTDELTGNGVADHNVNIMINDSSIYYSTVATNAYGYYMDTIVEAGFTVNSIYITTNDLCVFGVHDTLIQNPEPQVSANFQICVDTLVGGDCQAAFYAYADSSNQNTIYFYDQSTPTGDITSWYWDFGDGNYSYEQNPVHTYNTTGYQYVCLTITADSSQCTSVACEYVYVQGGGSGGDCEADFYYTVDSMVDLTVLFYDQSTSPSGNISYWNWDFGDGNYSYEQNPVHKFDYPGTYNVCLYIQIADSGMMWCSDTICMDVVVQAGGGGDCQADFYYTYDSTGTTSSVVSFFDQSTPVQLIESWYWDFGDGNYSYEQNPVHAYNASGYYNVCLTISADSSTCQSTYCEYIFVQGGGGDCQADFYFTFDSTGTSSTTVSFYDMSTPANLVDSWFWDFGDGTSSTEQNPVHSYNAPGTYGVCLTITADSGFCTSTTCDTIIIQVNDQFQLGGNVFAGMYQLDHGFAYAYKEENGVITEIYSELVDTLGYYLFYPLEAGDYYVKVEPSPTSLFFGSFMPTYYGDVTTWDDAVLINLTDNVYTADINLVPMALNVFGPGTMSGTIVHGSGNREETPAVGVQIMLTNEQGEFIGLTYSNEQGEFEFTGLPLGTLTLHAEVMGIDMTPKDYILTEENTEHTAISMIMTDEEIYFSTSGIESLFIDQISDIYPNPLNNELKVDMYANQPTTASFRIVNHLGQTVSNETFSINNYQTIRINTGNLKPGMFILEIITEDGYKSSKKFFKH